MEKEKIEIIKLKAAEGHTLTNGEAYGKEAYLGCNDRAEDWREISDSEYAEILRAEEIKMQNSEMKMEG